MMRFLNALPPVAHASHLTDDRGFQEVSWNGSVGCVASGEGTEEDAGMRGCGPMANDFCRQLVQTGLQDSIVLNFTNRKPRVCHRESPPAFQHCAFSIYDTDHPLTAITDTCHCILNSGLNFMKYTEPTIWVLWRTSSCRNKCVSCSYNSMRGLLISL